MGAQHTPGPWNAGSVSSDAVFAKGNCIAVTAAEVCDAEVNQANARLMAAAPEMLAQLKRDLNFAKAVVTYLKATASTKDVLFTSAEMQVEVLRAALAKAESRS